MLGVSLDGTLMNAGRTRHSRTLYNTAILDKIARLKNPQVAIITNQTEVPFSYQSNLYRTPEKLTRDLSGLIQRIFARGIKVSSIFICTYNPSVEYEVCKRAAEEIANAFAKHTVLSAVHVEVVYGPESGKPNPLMLILAKITEFWGDDDCDEKAAAACEVPFHRMESFYG